MPAIIKGTHYITQGYGDTPFARSAQGQRYYRSFGGIHVGVDLGTHRKKLVVVSPIEGTVVRAKMDGGWGNHIEVKGDDGWNRQFCHLDTMRVEVGQPVGIGTPLGTVGTTGSSTAIHLHFGNRKWGITGWQYRDPSADLEEIKEAKMPTGKLIKTKGDPAVYVFNGKTKFPLPNWETFTLLFGEKAEIELIDDAIATKIPTGELITNLK